MSRESAASSTEKSPHTTVAPHETTLDTRSVTGRVVILSLLLAALFGYIIPLIDFRFTNSSLGGMHLPAGAVGVLLLMVLVVNPLLKVLSARLAFSRNETLTIYITCLFSCLVPGRGAENFWVPNVIASFYYATRENQWLDFLQPYLKPWMTPALQNVSGGGYNEAVVKGWYERSDTIPWGAWMVPMLAWSSLILAMYVMLACLSVMLRAQWSDREALAFPLLRLPLAMTEDMEAAAKNHFWRNPLMWSGVAFALWIQGLNGLNFYFADVPIVPLELPAGPIFTEVPWTQMGGLTMRIWPMMVGIAYLLTTEVSFSLWVFYLFHKVQLMMFYYGGIPPDILPSPSWTRGYSKGFIAYQQFGAYWVFVLMVLWTGREHARKVLSRAFGRRRADANEKNEALPYPLAFWGFVLAFAFVVAWSCAAGIKPSIAITLWLTYLIIAIGLTRLVVEAGLPFVHTGWSPVGPWASLLKTGPSGWLIPSSAVPAAFIGSVMTDMRGFLLPSFVQGLKLAHDRRIEQRKLMALIFATILVAMAVGLWNNVRLGYQYGGLTLQEWWSRGPGAQAPGRTSQEFVKGVKDLFILNWAGLIVGVIITYSIMVARARYAWFPLHPVGYLMFTPHAITTLWLSIFMGWLLKVSITHFGGSENYRKLTPFFLGLILGDVSMTLFWLAIDSWQGRTGHQLLF